MTSVFVSEEDMQKIQYLIEFGPYENAGEVIRAALQAYAETLGLTKTPDGHQDVSEETPGDSVNSVAL